MEQPKSTFRQEDNVLIYAIILNAPRELVWEVWTQPEHIKAWWGPDGFTISNRSMNVAPGKSWEFLMQGMGQDFEEKILYTEVIPLSLLSYRHSDSEDNYGFNVTITFEEAGDNKTLLTMRSTFKSKAIIDELNRKVNAIEGGHQTLSKMAAYLEKIQSDVHS